MVKLLRHRQTKGPATDRLNLNHRATSRLYKPMQTDSVCMPLQTCTSAALADALPQADSGASPDAIEIADPILAISP